MGIIEKIKLLFKASKPIGQFIGQVKGARMKYKTIPFWISLSGSGLSLIAALNGFIPVTAALIATAILTAAYNILRGLDKVNQEGIKPVLKTTEFWLGAGAIISAQLVNLQTAGISSGALVVAQTIIAAAMAAAQNLAAHQPSELPPPIE